MNTFLCERISCTGCGACAAVCAAGAIALRPDEEGFLYPETDGSRCLNCGACGAVCPVAGEKESRPVLRALAARCRDEALQLQRRHFFAAGAAGAGPGRRGVWRGLCAGPAQRAAYTRG